MLSGGCWVGAACSVQGAECRVYAARARAQRAARVVGCRFVGLLVCLVWWFVWFVGLFVGLFGLFGL